jgi:hypothetical protein
VCAKKPEDVPGKTAGNWHRIVGFGASKKKPDL